MGVFRRQGLTLVEERLWQLVQNQTARIGNRITTAALLLATITFFLGVTVTIVLYKTSLNQQSLLSISEEARNTLILLFLSLALILAAITCLRKANDEIREKLTLTVALLREPEEILADAFTSSFKWLFYGVVLKSYGIYGLIIAIAMEIRLIFSLF